MPRNAPTAMTAGGTAWSAVFENAGYDFVPTSGKPSLSNGTAER